MATHARDHESGRDPYRLLGLTPAATPAQITTAYRRAVRMLHPDTVQSDTLHPDTVQSDTLHPDTVQPDTVHPDTVPPRTPCQDSDDGTPAADIQIGHLQAARAALLAEAGSGRLPTAQPHTGAPSSTPSRHRRREADPPVSSSYLRVGPVRYHGPGRRRPTDR